VVRAVGNDHGPSATGTANVAALNSAVAGSLTYVQELEFGSRGNAPISGPIMLTGASSNIARFLLEGGGQKTLIDSDSVSGVVPAIANVRQGTVYDSGNKTGTLAVPAAGSVALGVSVDNTTGTAVLTEAAVRSALGMASANLDTQLDGLPTAAENATAVWDAATRTITGGTVDTLTNSPDVPTEAEIAAQVRAELSTELSRIDATVSSRSTFDPDTDTVARVTLTDTATTLTNSPDVPSAEVIADEVRTELTTELERLANCATVETTGQQIQDALTPQIPDAES
jgi:hypothetical protein